MSYENRKDKPSLLCPRCGAEVVFSHRDDVGTEWFKCTKCGEQTSKPRRVYERPASKPGSEDLPDVHYSILEGWGKGVAIGPEDLFLTVDRAGEEWSFRLLGRYEEWKTLTSQINLKNPEGLSTSRHAKLIRDWLRKWHREDWRTELDLAIGVIQDYEAEWLAEKTETPSPSETRLMEPQLHPAGGVTDRFVYEPIGLGEYVYKTAEGRRGIARVRVEYDDPENKKGAHWFMGVEGSQWYFTEKPRETWLFHTPRRDMVEAWVKGTRKSLPIRILWDQSLIYYKTFLDLPRECEYHILVLGVVQSWLIKLLTVVFYLGIQGEWGGGKTVTGEAAVLPCRHGYQTGNLSPAFVARMIEKQKLTLFVDELDSVAGTQDSDLYQVFRQGYHRSGTYSRINPETMEEEVYHVFSPKIYSVHSGVETALQTRTIPLHTRETGNIQYPVIGASRIDQGRTLMEEWFLWYLDNVFDVRKRVLGALQVATVATVAPLGKGGGVENNIFSVDEAAQKTREMLFEKYRAPLQEGQLGQLGQLSGRNVELAYLMFTLSNLVDVNMDEKIVAAFEQKKMEESERTEIGFLGTLRDVLTAVWLEKRNDEAYLTESGEVKVSNEEIYSRYNKALKDAGNRGVSPSTFKGLLTELGFSDVLNRKKMKIPVPGEDEPKTRLCNIFTPRVLRKLDVESAGGSETLPSVGDELKIVYDKAWELAVDQKVSKFAVADALKDRIDPMEVFQLLEKLKEEDRLAAFDMEHYLVERVPDSTLTGLDSARKGVAGINPEDVVRIRALDSSTRERCAICGALTVLGLQAETKDGSWGYVCSDCAGNIKRENPEVEWLE